MTVAKIIWQIIDKINSININWFPSKILLKFLAFSNIKNTMTVELIGIITYSTNSNRKTG